MKRDHIVQIVIGNVLFDLPFPNASADEEEANGRIVLELYRRIQQRRQWIRWAVIAAVHDDEFIIRRVFPSKRILRMRQRLDHLLMGPWWDDDHLVMQPG